MGEAPPMGESGATSGSVTTAVCEGVRHDSLRARGNVGRQDDEQHDASTAVLKWRRLGLPPECPLTLTVPASAR